MSKIALLFLISFTLGASSFGAGLWLQQEASQIYIQCELAAQANHNSQATCSPKFAPEEMVESYDFYSSFSHVMLTIGLLSLVTSFFLAIPFAWIFILARIREIGKAFRGE